ncbi:glucan endo-1,3-beta-glucosidase 14-like [Salvia miltiorrhiza]|uniref:glucan endo-1,3-beta-glucosidase 14-like n=1 Tax=Salvia miltiorrhiza TaxID=226208 RepID=UPI0025AC61C6|nr:glucan endo-1,3-beta-glucosidase 14-like [Salvia miltiorrhiza]
MIIRRNLIIYWWGPSPLPPLSNPTNTTRSRRAIYINTINPILVFVSQLILSLSLPNPNMNCSHLLCCFLVATIQIHSVVSESGSVGINYGRIADNLPSPAQVVQLLKAQGITKVKLYDTDSAVLTAFSGSGISLTVALPNEQLSSAAADTSFTDAWVQSNILPYHPNTTIEAIAVGNEVFVDPNNTTAFLVPAMKNVHASLANHNLSSAIKISSPLALSALHTSYPSSAGAFKPELVEPVIKPMLAFLKQTGSYLMVNAYPFFAYIANTDTISLDYALLRDNAGNKDPNNGLLYKTLFEAQTDAVFAAMSAVGFDDVGMVVSETGWPSKGDENEVGAGPENAAAYNGNLVRRVLTGGGTPLRPKEPLNVYLFALFNEDQKPGATSERNYGLFYPNQRKVYDIPLTVEALKGAPNLTESKTQVEAAGQTWCVANDKAGEKKLQKAMDYACGEGGADCRPIQPEATCYNPNTVEAHASYAFNSYYQKNSRRSGACDFGGAAYVVTHPPKFGSCEFPTGY